MTKQPFLTDFPLTVFATAKRRLQAAIRQSSAIVARRSLSGYAVLFEDLLPGDFLSPIDPTQRQRSFGHLPVFWAWLVQILEANASCQKAVGLIQSWCRSCDLPEIGVRKQILTRSHGTGAFAHATQSTDPIAGAYYHVMARGNRRETVFQDDDDRRSFLTTLAEACAMTGWRDHARVLKWGNCRKTDGRGSHISPLGNLPGQKLERVPEAALTVFPRGAWATSGMEAPGPVIR